MITLYLLDVQHCGILKTQNLYKSYFTYFIMTKFDWASDDKVVF